MASDNDEQEELTSKEILKSYLLKSIYQLITKGQFHALLNKIAHHTVDDETVTWLLNILNDEMLKQHVSVVRNNIGNTTLVEDDNSSNSESSDKLEISSDELSKLITSMKALDRSVKERLRYYKSISDETIRELTMATVTVRKPSNMDNYEIDRLTETLENVKSYLTKKE